jgi:hypothetical protein
MRERRLTRGRLRLWRLEEEAATVEEPRGILEIFAESGEDPADADEALTRADEEPPRE